METKKTSGVYTPDQLITPEVIANPYPAYRQLRDQSPVNYLFLPGGIIPGIEEPVRGWALMKYSDVYGVLRDHDTFSSAQHPVMHKILARLVILWDDPPRHTRFRHLVNKAFTLKRIEVLEPWITSVANELLDEINQGEVDLVQAYTIPLPMKVIARLLGIPGEHYAIFNRWADACLSFSSLAAEERQKNLQEMMAYFAQMVAARRSHGAEDIITALVEAESEGEFLQDWEILEFCRLLLIAGHETTKNLLGNLINLLVERPALWQQLRADRSLVEPVIEETLRYESPIQRLPRVTARKVEISGVTIPQGEIVLTFFGAANRDPATFPHPDEFRLDRASRNHVAFGMGIHYCLGAPLARTEAKITLNAFLDRFPVLTRGDTCAIRQTASTGILGFQQLPLVLGTGGQ